jgi:hypothetical protein
MCKQPFVALIVKCLCARQIGVVKSVPCLAILNINAVKIATLVAVMKQAGEEISQKKNNFQYLLSLTHCYLTYF